MAQTSFWASLAKSLGITSASAARKEAMQQHIANLTHPAEDTRRSAAWSLAKMGKVSDEAVAALEKASEKDPSTTVRKAAQWALKSLKSPK